MKRIPHILTVVFFVLVFPRLIVAQQKTPPKIEWQKCLGGSNAEWSTSIQQTSDGGYIVVGTSTSNDGDLTLNNASYDIWVVKLSDTGRIEWQRSLGGTRNDEAYSIQQTSDDGYIVAGVSQSFDGDVTGVHGETDYWIIKLTSNGLIEWQRTLGGSFVDRATSIQQTSDGGYIVGGYSESIDGVVTGNHAHFDYWVAKLSSTGILEWEKSLGGNSDDLAYSLCLTTDGGFILAGYSSSEYYDVSGNHGNTDIWIVKLTYIGNIEWQRCYGGLYDDKAFSIQQTDDTGYIIGGISNSNDGDVLGHHGTLLTDDAWVVKITSVGDIEWQRSLGGSDLDYVNSIQQTKDGGYIVGCYSRSSDGDVTGHHDDRGGIDAWIVKLTNSGVIDWQKSLGGKNSESANSIQQTKDGGYIFTGYTASNDGDVNGLHGQVGNYDFWIVKLSPEGTSSVETKLVTTHNISITPNPASTSATLTLESDEAGACEVQIISVTGATLKEYSTYLTTGKQEIALTDLESLPAGMYEVIVKRSNYQTLRTKLVVE